VNTSLGNRPIGVFDSGIGGLTVVAALRRLLPTENILYLGDTARVPYGSKSPATVQRYSREISRFLTAANAKLLVVACNTASAMAVPLLRKEFDVPVVGVVEPGAAAAVAATRNHRIGVMATRATVRSGAYENAMLALRNDVTVTSHACPLLVPLIEEGWVEDVITDQVITRYLAPLRQANIDTLVLGCTHYPLLAAAVARAAGDHIALVDSARNCAEAVKTTLQNNHLMTPADTDGRLEVVLTDPADAFLVTAAKSLNLEIDNLRIEHLTET